MDQNHVGLAPNTLSPAKAVPLLQSLNRAEEMASALAVRLDPITNHAPSQDKPPALPTVTGRLTSLGDMLQYLLDNIEL